MCGHSYKDSLGLNKFIDARISIPLSVKRNARTQAKHLSDKKKEERKKEIKCIHVTVFKSSAFDIML